MAIQSTLAAQMEWTVQHTLDRIGAGLDIRLHVETMTAVNKDVLAQFVNQLREFIGDYQFQAKGIRNNPALSEIGKQEALEPILKKLNTRFNGICECIITLQKRFLAKVDTLYALPAAVITGDPVILEMRAQEVRRYLAGLSMPDRITLLLSNNDPFLIYAIENAPDCIQLIHPATLIDNARRARVERLRKGELEVLEDERLVLERIAVIYNNVPNTLYEWVHIVPALIALPDTVLPLETEEEA